jgi:hypothetical protein
MSTLRRVITSPYTVRERNLCIEINQLREEIEGRDKEIARLNEVIKRLHQRNIAAKYLIERLHQRNIAAKYRARKKKAEHA